MEWTFQFLAAKVDRSLYFPRKTIPVLRIKPLTLRQQAAALRQSIASNLPSEVLADFAAERDRLAAIGVPPGIAEPGTPLPDAKLFDIRGRATTLSAVRGADPAVIVFYRGAWCPFCNMTLRAYELELVPALQEQGIKLIAISPQKSDGLLTAQQTNALSFTVLSDPGNKLARAIGILSPPRSESARAGNKKLRADIAASNADGTDAIPMPTTLVADASGIIRWIDVHADYTTRSEVGAILAAISFAK